jgi:ClpP class serine protease
MEKIYAFEDTFLISYLERRENMKADEIKAAFELFGSVPEDSDEKILSIDGDTAKIKIEGPLSRKGPDYIDRYLGYSGTGYDEIAAALDEVAGNDSIKKLKLLMNTPGGEASGVDHIYNKIMDLRLRIKCYAINCGQIASAGYWIASPCRIYSQSPINITGSIGAMLVTIDRTFTKIDDENGFRRVRLVSKNAPDKAPDISKPAARKPMQDLVDALERCMIKNIASGRGVSTETVIKNYGKGAMLTASDPDGENDALRAGLIDGIIENTDDDELFSSSNSETLSNEIINGNTPAGAGNNTQEVIKMTLKELLAANPAAQIEYDAAIKAAKEDGEKDGIAAVRANVEFAAKFVAPESSYPSSIKAIACDVIAGKKSKESLETTVGAFDAFVEKQKSDAAAAEALKVGETGGKQEPDITTTGEIKTEADFSAEVARSKKVLGIQ